MFLDDDKIFITLALAISKKSKCIKRQVGAVIAKMGRVVSTGYNGPPAGYHNCNRDFEDGCPRTSNSGCLYALHAELNAVVFAYKNNIDLTGSTIYITLSPCIDCAKLIYIAGIKKVIFLYKYSEYKKLDREEGIEFLEAFGVTVHNFCAETVIDGVN